MKFLQQSNYPLLLFYVLVVYIFSSFSWWTILHIQKNNQSFNDKIEILRLKLEQKSVDSQNIEQFFEYKEIEEKMSKKNWMILGEGLVFILILGYGFYLVRNNFNKEIDLNRQQRNFLLSITHELKSPLAGMKMTIETLIKRKNIDEKNKEKLLVNALHESERLGGLVENLLLAARLDDANFQLNYERIELNATIKRIINQIEIRHTKRAIQFISNEDRIYILGDRFAWQIILFNLIENAIKYSEVDEAIGVKLNHSQQDISISIWDKGIGIPDDLKKNVFKKFYRMGSEDTRSTKGTGLGLFIVKQLVDLQDGKIEVKNNTPKGSKFMIQLKQSKA